MRITFLILLCFVFINNASAKCAGFGSIYVINKTTELNINGKIILEFYGNSRKVIPDLNNKYPIYLKSKNDKVKLLVIGDYYGEFDISQVVLKTERKLINKELYSLYIDSLPQDQPEPRFYNTKTKQDERFSFLATNKLDTQKPFLNNTIQETGKSCQPYGCGPAKWVNFKVQSEDKSELFAKVQVENKATKKKIIYIVRVNDGQIGLGHGMCSGAFRFDKGEEYEATIELMDQSGNMSKNKVSVKFTRPVCEDY